MGLGTLAKVAVQQRGQLVSCRDPRVDQVSAGAGHGPQGQGLGRVRDGDAKLVLAQPQVLGDHQGVAGVALGPGQHLAVAPGLDRVRLDRDHRVAGLQQRVDQPPAGALDRDWHPGGLAEGGQPPDQGGEPGSGMLDGELGLQQAVVIGHGHGMGLGRPVDPGEERHDRHARGQG